MSYNPVDADRRIDVREIEGEPFGDIMDALDDLSLDESLLLINSFEPEPLYNVLEQHGFTYKTENPESDIWYVKIEHA